MDGNLDQKLPAESQAEIAERNTALSQGANAIPSEIQQVPRASGTTAPQLQELGFPRLETTNHKDATKALAPDKTEKTLQSLQTPENSQLKPGQDQFPELSLAREATQLSATNWQQADALFKQAESSIDNQVASMGGLSSIQQSIDAIKMQTVDNVQDYNSGTIPFPEPPGPQKDADAKLLSTMTNTDVIEWLAGEKGPETQAAMQRVFPNTKALLAFDNQKAANLSLIRMDHAVMASEYGFSNNDRAAKNEAKTIVEGIAKIDPETFQSSPEVQGALAQANQGKQMNVADGSASAVAYSESAKDIIPWVRPIDIAVPGASLLFQSVGSADFDREPLDKLEMAILSNPEEAQSQRNRTVLGDLLGGPSGLGEAILYESFYSTAKDKVAQLQQQQRQKQQQDQTGANP